MPSYTFLTLIEDVLKETELPLTCREIWQRARENGLSEQVTTQSDKPWNTVSAVLSQDIHTNPGTKLIRLGGKPQRYFLKSRESEMTPDWLKKVKQGQIEKKGVSQSESKFRERDLHPLLAYAAYSNPVFSSGGVYTKTIAHEKTGRGSLSQWMHPDMVGVYFPFDDMEREVIELNKKLNPDSVIKIFSFELKKELTVRNYRENFFQAISNSSWAHTSYLVAAEISDDEELHLELERLSNAFGIGVFHLDMEDIDSSDAIYPARTRNVLDWETINKLCEINEDFHSFIEAVLRDLQSGHIYGGYDDVPEDPEKYIRKLRKQ